MSSWSNVDDNVPFSPDGRTVMTGPMDTPPVAQATQAVEQAPVEVSVVGNSSYVAPAVGAVASGDGGSSSSGSSGGGQTSSELSRQQLDYLAIARQNATITPQELMGMGASQAEAETAIKSAEWERNPYAATGQQTASQIAAENVQENQQAMADISKAMFGIAGVAAGAAVVANADGNAIAEGFNGSLGTANYVSSALNQIKVDNGQSVDALAANVMASGTPEMRAAMDGVDVPARSLGLGAVLSDLKGFNIDESQFKGLSPEVMAQVNGAGRSLLASNVAGVGEYRTLTDTIDNSMSANAGIAGAGVAQQQSVGRV